MRAASTPSSPIRSGCCAASSATSVPGAIVLMHEGAAHGRNLEGMAMLLERLDTLGYRTMLPEALEGEVVADTALAA